jgi:cytochrome c oxidase assembly protein subunit 15
MVIKSVKNGLVGEQGMIKKLFILAFVMTFIVITLGALTRLLDAGLGCPDWPGCYGEITPPTSELSISDKYEHTDIGGVLNQGKAWMEMIHRYLATSLGLVILLIAGLVQHYQSSNNRLLWCSRGLVLLVILQGLFGMWTVTMKLWPQVVTLHLLGGLSVLGTIAYGLFLETKKSALVLNEKSYSLARIGLVILVFQLALGGWTSSTYSGLACPDFPTCQNSMLPDLKISEAFNVLEFNDASYQGGQLSAQARVTVQVVHRIVALILTFILLLLSWNLFQLKYKRLAASLIVFTAFQVSLGILNAVLLLPLLLALLHNTGAVILLLALLNINFKMKKISKLENIEIKSNSELPSSIGA